MSTNENERRETIFHSVLCVSIEQCSMIDVRKLKYLKQLTCNLSSFSVSAFSSKIRYHFPLLLMLNLLLLKTEGTVASWEIQNKRTLSSKYSIQNCFLYTSFLVQAIPLLQFLLTKIIQSDCFLHRNIFFQIISLR